MAGIEHLSSLWWNAIGVAALKSTFILTLAGLIVWLMRNRSPAVRFRVWLGGLLSAAALPVVTAAAPDWPLLPSWLDAANWSSASAAATAATSAPATFEILTTGVAAIWFAGFCWLCGRASLAAFMLRCIALTSRKLEGNHRLSKVCRRLQRQQQFGRRVDLYLAEGEARPLAWGVARASILLPESAEQWDLGRAEAVLIHELEHLRRRDGLAQVFEQLVCAIYWFHPLVWWAISRLRYEREAACDDAVLMAGVLPTDYAESLLALSHPNSQAWRAPALAASMAEAGALPRRIREILSAKRTRNPLSKLAAGAATMGFAAALLLLASLTAAPPTLPIAADVARATQLNDNFDGLPPALLLASQEATPRKPAPGMHPRLDPLLIGRRELPRNSQLLLNVAPTESTAKSVDDPKSLESINGWRAEPPSPKLSLDEADIDDDNKSATKPPMRQSPTDIHGRVSQATPTFAGRPMPL